MRSTHRQHLAQRRRFLAPPTEQSAIATSEAKTAVINHRAAIIGAVTIALNLLLLLGQIRQERSCKAPPPITRESRPPI